MIVYVTSWIRKQALRYVAFYVNTEFSSKEVAIGMDFFSLSLETTPVQADEYLYLNSIINLLHGEESLESWHS
jgi:hypothetical protein